MSQRMMHAGRFVRPWNLKSASPATESARSAYRGLLAMIEEIPTRGEAIKTDLDLSDRGRATRRAALVDVGAPALKAARAAFAEGQAQIAALQEKMVRSAVDKGDVAAAILRSEIRTWFRGMPDAKRNGMIAMGLDSTIAAAVAEAPAELSGVSATQHQAVSENLVMALNPAEVAAIEEITEALASLASAEEAGRRVMVREAGVTESALSETLGEPTISDRIRQRLADNGVGADGEPAEEAVER